MSEVQFGKSATSISASVQHIQLNKKQTQVEHGIYPDLGVILVSTSTRLIAAARQSDCLRPVI
ncbi:hypothetical protein M7I_0027 [Glarea lozoyensis 74030]|uniref:Uncharacterized protein n=1 Tax=Glarea lozoyensis (strain ATCC 74030 / MF5533) TaxID=1104152 RepID=H0EC94_GLAL7|nr:hypothetical protein M7I_0027 [Glarea lozoyensis 74030]